MATRSPEILDIVGQLHEGVVDDVLWQRAIGSVCDLLDIPALLMGTVSRGGKSVELAFGHRAEPHAVALLEGPLASPEHNPWLGLARGHGLRRVATIEDVGGQQHLESTRIWSDFYVPFKLGDSIGSALERQPEYANILMAGRRTGNPGFRERDRRALEALLPHIARAWRVKRALTEMQSLVGALSSALDRLERAVVVTGPEGEIRFANHSADRLLSRGNAIDAKSGRLRAARPRHSDALHALIGRAAETAIGKGAMAVDAVALPCDEGAPLAVVAEPLAPAHGSCIGGAAKAGAILFIGDSEASRSPPAGRMQIVYGLTTAEARLAAAIVEGNGVTSAGESLGISPNTAKYHLKAVFGKVGVANQAQLVRRVLADVGGLAEPEKLKPRALD